MPRVLAQVGNASVVCEVADTPSAKSIGLQKHAGLQDHEGMLFPFYPTKHVQFHMGLVRFPIDIVFCNHNRVAHIVSDIQPGTRGRWGAKCDLVLEVRGGWCAENGVKVGTVVQTSDLKTAAQTYDLLRTLTTAQSESDGEESDEEPKPTPISALKTLEDLERKGRVRPAQEIAAGLYFAYLQEVPEAIERDSLSRLEVDRIVQARSSQDLWKPELKKLADAGLLPGYEEDPKTYEQQLAWRIGDEMLSAVQKAHAFYGQHKDDWDHLAPFMDTVRQSRRQKLAKVTTYAKAAQQLLLYMAPMGPSYLSSGDLENKFYSLLDLFDGRAASQQIEAKWADDSKEMDFIGRDAVVRALVDSGYPDAIRLLKVSQMQSLPDIRQDMKQPGAIRRTPPEQSWSGNEMPAETMGVGDAADRSHWDQELGYDASAPELLEGHVPPMRPSASVKTAGGDIHPGDRVRATEKADGLKDDQKGVCLEVQGDMVWIKFDGEPVPRWLKNDMLTQEQEKEQVLQEIEQEQQQGEGGGSGGGGLAGLLG